ncbi:type 1 glutamine amidotransferase [Gordonia sp. DT30]|uniref:type 1 glutamine amidotransferase n=1 Tax=unclassified Gordonia (in: high G+C Gram-positive bacteria) TaxID=2657482 RepID=UPI003CEFE173
MTVDVLELRHIECESSGAYGAGLADVADIHTVRAWCDELPADPRAFAAILVMGGPMSANDGATLPWIDDEIAFLVRALDAGIPVWGVCLGSQLLARALGADVTTGAQGEVGVAPISVTDEGRADPVFSAAPETGFPAMHWHYDTFAIPDGAVRLASSSRYPNQAFRHGMSYGVQFHLEVDGPLLRDWLDAPGYRAELVEALGPDGPSAVLADTRAAQSTTVPLAGALIRRWFTLVTGSDPSESRW